MATFTGDMLRILAHGGMQMGTSALGQYLGNVFAGDKAESLAILNHNLKALESANPDQAQAIAGLVEKNRPGTMALLPKVQGYAPPGLEPSADTPNPKDQLLATQSSPVALQSMLGATPLTRGETTEPVPSTTFAVPAAKLEQQVANLVQGAGANPLSVLGKLKKLEQPQKEVYGDLFVNDQTGEQKYMPKGGSIPSGWSLVDKSKDRLGLTMDAAGNPVYDVLKPGMPGPKPAEVNDPQAVDYVANIFNKTGEMPGMGMGAAGFRKAVLTRAAQLQGLAGGSADDVVANKAFYKSLTSGLTQLEKQKTLLEPFMETMDKNVEVALDTAKKLDRTGVPAINAWINAGRRTITGNPELAAFDLANKTVINEYVRILTSASAGNTQMAESEIKKMEGMLSSAQTPDQYLAVLDIIKRDTQNRKDSLYNGIELKRKQLKELNAGGGGTQPKPAGAATVPPKTNLKTMSTDELKAMAERLRGGQ